MSENSSTNRMALFALFALFFMWGFMTVMNDVLIPYLKSTFALNYAQASLVQGFFFGAYAIGSLIYFLISVISGDPIQRIGYKNGILLGLVVSALGAGLFYPAAMGNAYWPYLLALFVLGLGFTMLQIAANPYVAIIGKSETASSRLNMAQGFNSLGTTIGPLIGGFLIFKYFAGAEAVKWPYLMMAGILLVLVLVFIFTPLPKVVNTEKIERGFGSLRFSQLRFGIIAIFVYVGGEVAIGSYLINYIGLPEIMGLAQEDAKNFLSWYWGGLMIGRFMGAISMGEIEKQVKKYGFMILAAIACVGLIFFADAINRGIFGGETDASVILDILSWEILPWVGFVGLNFLAFILGKGAPARTLAIFATAVIVLLAIGILGNGSLAFYAVLAIGLFNSIMWSNIFTLSIHGLGKYTSQGSSLLVMAIFGGAVVPLLQGTVADSLAKVIGEGPDSGLQLSFIIPLLCYVYLLFYGLRGYKPKETADERREAGGEGDEN